VQQKRVSVRARTYVCVFVHEKW